MADASTLDEVDAKVGQPRLRDVDHEANDMSAAETATVQVGSTITIVGEFGDGGDLGVEIGTAHLA